MARSLIGKKVWIKEWRQFGTVKHEVFGQPTRVEIKTFQGKQQVDIARVEWRAGQPQIVTIINVSLLILDGLRMIIPLIKEIIRSIRNKDDE